MTNTLHRQGTVDSLKGDYIVFAFAAAGYNKEGSGPLKRRFLEMCLKHEPVNTVFGRPRPARANFIAEYLRDRRHPQFYGDGKPTPELRRYWETQLKGVEDDTIALAVFDSVEKLAALVQEVKAADLGLSINVTALHDDTDRALREAGIIRHTIEHSLGFHGRTERLPAREILEVSTMCGHGLVGFNLVKKMLDAVKLGQMTPERAAEYLMKPCTCGAFNPVRAAHLLREYRARV